MITYEDRCVGCPPEMGCMGSYCPNRNAAVYICDACGDEAPLYEYDGEQLCLNCIKERLERVI